MSQPTPGPFRVEFHRGVASIYRAHDPHNERGLIAKLQYGTQAEIKADALLFGAAPDLLAFAEWFVRATSGDIHEPDHDGPDERRCTIENPLCMEMTARAAIRKATAP